MKNTVIFLLLVIIKSKGFVIKHVDNVAVSNSSLSMKLAGTIKSAMESLIVISDNKTDSESIMSFISKVVDRPITCIREDELMPTLTSLLQTLLPRESIKELKTQLNFAVIGKSEIFSSVIKKAEILDATFGVKSVLRHFSKWIWFPTHEKLLMLQNVTTTLDNVAVFRTENNGSIVIDTLLWTPNGRKWSTCPTLESSNIFPNYERGLNGRTLTVAILEFIPHSKRNVIDGDIIYGGSSHEIMSQISNKLNFSIRYVEPDDQQWGQITNSSWDGIVGMLERGEADLCSVPYAMNIERSKVMTFTFPNAYMYHSAVYRKSEDESTHWKVLVSCFRWELYLCGLVVIGVVVAVIILSQRMIKEYQTFTVFDAIGHGVAIPLRQSLSWESSLASYRILLSFWWLYCIIMTSLYTGNLIAMLTVSREYVPFRTLEEIGEQNKYKVSFTSGSYMELLLKTTEAPELKKIWEKTRHTSDQGSFTASEELDYLRRILLQEHTVLIMDEPSIDVLMSKTCGLTKISKSFMPVYSAMPFPKFSPLAQLFASELMALTEGGMVSKWYNDLIPQQKQCNSDRGKFQLQLRDLLSAFVALAAGVFVSSIVLFCECLLRHT